MADIVAAHDGVRPVEQGEGDSFVVAFARASDAVACALELQRAPLAPIRLRIGVHTGEIQLRDEGNYIGPTINRTARLRDLGHGGQTVLSGATEAMVLDRLPASAWLTELGTHPLRDLPRPERVVQLCHPDLVNDFPPLRVSMAVVAKHLPAQLTSFVGRDAEMNEVRELLADNRLVTLTGAGGVGKTRLAIQVAAQLAGEFSGGVWYVDLAPVTDPDLVAVTVARALGLPDQPGRSTMDTLLRFVRDRQMLVVLDNCEHLLDASAELVVAVLSAAPGLTMLATSREAIGVAGEVSWRVPSLSVADEAIELFTDRARHARPGFRGRRRQCRRGGEICARLDGVPLAIELAAARVRALSLAEILDSLHDRFRLLTGGARTAVRRQQTLRASVDWSHALLTDPERVLFRRLAAFLGGFDLDAAQAVAGGGDVQRYQVLDQLTLLVDKSLVVADDTGGRTRYRLLETVRQYALEKLGESGEADAVRTRHRDHYTSMAALLDAPAGSDYEQRIEQADLEMDNLRAAFEWSRETSEVERRCSLRRRCSRCGWRGAASGKGVAWFDTALGRPRRRSTHEVAAAVHARALADRALLAALMGAADAVDQAQQALAIAREVDDPALLARALTACGYIAALQRTEVARRTSPRRSAWPAHWTIGGGSARSWPGRRAGRSRRVTRWRCARPAKKDATSPTRSATGSARASAAFAWAVAHFWQGDLASAAAQFAEVAAEAETAHDRIIEWPPSWARAPCWRRGVTPVRPGPPPTQPSRPPSRLEGSSRASLRGVGPSGPGRRRCRRRAGCDRGGPAPACDDGRRTRVRSARPRWRAEICRRPPLRRRHRREHDRLWLMSALTTRARVAIAQGEPEQAERDSHDALAIAADIRGYLGVPDTLECLGTLAGEASSHREAARLFGAALGIRERIGEVRFQVWDAGYDAAVSALREAMGEKDFDAAWAEGAALSTEEAIAYAQRGRGERKRPTAGWASLTPTERDVVRLVSEGLANKDIAARLFVSPRTVQTHLTHVYTKLGLTSRVQLAQEAARHVYELERHRNEPATRGCLRLPLAAARRGAARRGSSGGVVVGRRRSALVGLQQIDRLAACRCRFSKLSACCWTVAAATRQT